ncbi:MAG TPA: AMP-binding protein [Candidatus Lokiarchaeia archaeon]
MTVYSEKIWKKNWDKHVKDLDQKSWNMSFVDSIKQSFEEDPNKMALAFLGVEITFGQLDNMANQFANMLLDNGMEKGDVVAVNLPNTPQYVIALIGALRAGCAISGVSPLMSAVQIEYQLNDLSENGKRKVVLVTLDAVFEHHITKIAPKLKNSPLIVTTNVASFLPKIKQKLGKLLKKIPVGKVTPLPDKKVIDFTLDILEKYPSTPVKVKITPDDVCFIQYTGGTTGAPKGAMLTHSNAVSDLMIVQKWINWERGKHVALSAFPLFHIAGLFFAENCLQLGWGQVLIPDPRNTNEICKQYGKYKPIVLVNVPSLFQMLIKNPKFKSLDHSNLMNCISAASPFPVESQKELEAIVGKGQLLEVYGMTETSPLTTMNPSKGTKKLGSIGLPLTNMDLKLVDPGTNKEVALGEAGEILVRGPMIMKGYLNKQDETAKTIDKDGYMHTGDVAIMDEEGYLKIVDRTKDMIIVSGFKVFSTKVEDVLAKHPAVGMIALVGIANPERPGSENVKAFVQLKPDYPSTDEKKIKEDIINFAKEKLSPYEIPKIIEIVKEMPLTAVGKIDKKILRVQK